MIPNQWYAVLPSAKVKPGRIVAAKRLNLDLAFFRTAPAGLFRQTGRLPPKI